MFNRNGERGRIVSIAISLSRWHVENRWKTGGWREQTGAGGEVGGGAGVLGSLQEISKKSSGKVGGGGGVLGILLPPDYDKMTAPPHLEGEKAEILVDLEVLGIPRLDEVTLDFEKGWKLL